MRKEPMCPYCGSQMETTAKSRFDEQKNEWWTGWCFCSSCGAEGPKAYGRLTMGRAMDDVRELAVQRYEPPAKPLTLDQFNAIYSTREDHVWPFDACPPYLFLESAIEPNDFCWISWGVAKTLFEQGYRAYSADNYGEKWRFWTRKPTDEERRAGEWKAT